MVNIHQGHNALFLFRWYYERKRLYYLATIPKGKVVTYGQIAKYLGNKNLSRAIGNILHKNPDKDK